MTETIDVKILDSGMFLNLLNIPTFRTPAILKIKMKDLPLFSTQLVRSGCRNFSITTSDYDIPVDTLVSTLDKSINDNDIVINNNENLKVSKENNDLLKKIEKLIKDINVKNTVIYESDINKIKLKDDIESNETMFVPNDIGISNIENNIKIQKSENNEMSSFDEAINSLSKL